jgi:hypothetical protein
VYGSGLKMKKTIELRVNTSDMEVLYGIGVHVILDDDSVGIIVSNAGNVLDATHYNYEELGIEVKELPKNESDTKE